MHVNKVNAIWLRYKKWFTLTALALFLFFVVPLPKFVEVDFYEFHVWECQQAHAHNMSYSLCSGFWYEPQPGDISNPWVWHPSEDPYTIPHGSCLGTTKTVIVFGIYGFLTSPWYT